jgi:uncharacterized protein YegP (UPF0339 family)
MYHIIKTRSKKEPYAVVLIGANGELLSRSENFTRKQAAWKNIYAQVVQNNSIGAYAQDDTLYTCLVYGLIMDGRKYRTYSAPKPKYIPGKNPKKRKK